jgi:hypothetical protein
MAGSSFGSAATLSGIGEQLPNARKGDAPPRQKNKGSGCAGAFAV